jgi:hypothetical protein
MFQYYLVDYYGSLYLSMEIYNNFPDHQVINYLLRGWLKNLESEGSVDLPFLEERSYAERGVSRELEFVREGSRKSVSVRLYGTKISLWSQLSSFLNTRVPKSRIVLR